MNYKRLSDVLRSTANLIEDFGSALDFDDVDLGSNLSPTNFFISKEDLKVFLDMADDIEEKMLDVAQECGAVVIVQGGK